MDVTLDPKTSQNLKAMLPPEEWVGLLARFTHETTDHKKVPILGRILRVTDNGARVEVVYFFDGARSSKFIHVTDEVEIVNDLESRHEITLAEYQWGMGVIKARLNLRDGYKAIEALHFHES